MMSCECIKLVTRLRNNVIITKRGCWEWQGATSGNGNGAGRGYGRISVYGRTSATHRVMWSCVNGYLPPSKQTDHTCNNRLCCNPEHLELVNSKENHKRRIERKTGELKCIKN